MNTSHMPWSVLSACIRAGDPAALEHVAGVIRAHSHSVTRAASELGVDRAYLYRLVARYPTLRAAVDEGGTPVQRSVLNRGQQLRPPKKRRRAAR